ncbi:MAG: hypothetical protein C4537_07290 [Acholeplasma sp.]|jgi:biotin transport system substrate-specific component|nr:MAG: hypothetical protein C4537_07290 [Acholeplasma sp.]
MTTVKHLIRIGMFAAILAVSVYLIPPIFMPFIHVSVTIQTLIIFLIGYVLTPKEAFLSVMIYIIIGAIGLPVFSGAQGGITHLIGPTGGFILYFPVMAYFVSVTKKASKGWFYHFVSGFIIGILMLYLFSNLWLSYSLGISYFQGLIGLAIFIPFDIMKWALAYLVYRRFPVHIFE